MPSMALGCLVIINLSKNQIQRLIKFESKWRLDYSRANDLIQYGTNKNSLGALGWNEDKNFMAPWFDFIYQGANKQNFHLIN